MCFSAEKLASILHQMPPVYGYCVALSGGMDSVVLLHALAQLKRKHQLAVPLQAVYVHHGLQPDADDWALFCAEFTRHLKLPFQSVAVKVDTTQGGVEAAARQARYGVFAQILQGQQALLTAHHQDDQAETALLHFLKGGGVAGLAAMPVIKPFAQGWHFRPLLTFRRDALLQYANKHQLDWVEDTSNYDITFERNFLRQQIIPELTRRWPASVKAMARASAIQSDMLELQAALAEKDLDTLQAENGALSIADLLLLSSARRHNVLRHWLKNAACPLIPTKKQLQIIDQDVLRAGAGANPEIVINDLALRRNQGYLYQEKKRPALDANTHYSWPLSRPLYIEETGHYLEPTVLMRLFPQLRHDDVISVRFRRGGERFVPQGQSQSRALKKQLQQWQVASWQRDRLPLFYFREQLLLVWGYAAGEP